MLIDPSFDSAYIGMMTQKQRIESFFIVEEVVLYALSEVLKKSPRFENYENRKE